MHTLLQALRYKSRLSSFLLDDCAVGEERGKAGGLPADPSYRAVVQKTMELGRFGQKTGVGYYRYDGRTPVHAPEVEQICVALAEKHGIARRNDITDEEIIERCLYRSPHRLQRKTGFLRNSAQLPGMEWCMADVPGRKN